MASSSIVTYAPDRFRSRNTLSGTSGLALRACVKVNTASSTMATPTNVSATGSAKPSSPKRVIA